MIVQFNKNILYGALLLLSASSSVIAENEDLISQCANVESDSERISCLENALRGDPPGATASAALAGEEPAVVEEPIPAAQDEMEAEAEPVVVEAAASATEVEEFGLSEQQKDPEPLKSVDIVVIAVDKTAYNKLIYTTESGQVWLQKDHGTPRYREIPFDATIRKGTSGSFFIQPRAGGIAVRVSRQR